MITRATGHAYLDAQGWGPSGRPLAFAHRGGAEVPELVGLENTLRAFQHAVDLGYGYLETDVHLTRDGVLVSFHDELLDRVTDRVGAIGALTAQEVALARISGSEAVPTLAELFDAFPGVRFNIDLKSDGAGAALADFLRERDAEDRVLVGSFSSRRLREFRRATRGRVPTSAAPIEVVAFKVLPGRLSRWLTRGWVNALQVPHRRGRFRVVTPRLLRRAHALGVQVHVWTIDDPAEMEHLLDLGVDGLMTDRTDVLKDVLSTRGLWKDRDDS